ncbi:cilia- and flagella-associated protein 100 isoform X3 [Catharus ustulatus]|uniref:cilia- and flagella-associated protein 100 isoform X3 n=1 Tax=Catharus ustulatus TaxID=91951 RepID=UPI00140D22E1|nr:cilia- and flagella-associated protein 100 isoform X3 [Catharus ustulatus]
METPLVLSDSTEDEDNPMKNPFKVPSDAELFSVRNKEIKKAQAEYEKTMKVHEKTTYSTKMKAKSGLRRALKREEEEEGRTEATCEERLKVLQEMLSRKLAMKKDYALDRETFHGYLQDRKQIFYLEYAIAVKRGEIEKMETIAKNEEKKLEKAERRMEKDAAMFDEFLKENHNRSVEALRIARRETSAKAKKVTEIHGITTQIKKIQRSSLEDAESESSSDDDEEPELYFTHPEQLLLTFTEMLDENLSFVLNSQDIAESWNKVQQTFITTRDSMEKELAALKEQVNTLQDSVAKEEEKVADLKLKVQCFSSGEHQGDEQDEMLTSLNKKVLEVYSNCTGDNETNLPTVEMLKVIEKKLNDLLDSVERIPPAKIEKAVKAIRKEHRARLREERQKQAKQQQDEGLKRDTEKSQVPEGKKVSTVVCGNTSPQQLTLEELGVPEYEMLKGKVSLRGLWSCVGWHLQPGVSQLTGVM